ncbi:MAG: hypothetical protein BGP16_12830 [Sphingobium sp. 66-54]|nr:MAG: hypothetical protein BGP16_12830 [Sphingobium sp. 66-54]
MIRGDRIRERLNALDRSQGWLAREIEVSPQAISKMVSGKVGDSPKLYQIARALETSVEFLIGESDDASPQRVAEGRGGYRAEPLAKTGRVQYVSMAVAMPNENALADMMESLLALVPENATRVEAARILAQRLPAGFAAIGPVQPAAGTETMTASAKSARSPATGRSSRQRS